MTKNPSLTVVEPLSVQELMPPLTLGEPGRALWLSIQREYQIRDSGGLEVLRQACHAADRAASCAAAIAEQGEVINTKAGLRDHPLLRHEATARALTCRLLQKLGINLEPVRTPGRPAHGFGWRGPE
jgi:hypothetical protein